MTFYLYNYSRCKLKYKMKERHKKKQETRNQRLNQLNKTVIKHPDSSAPLGDESGGFSFTVTDGEHTSPLYQFVITARPLTITMVTQEELMVFPGKMPKSPGVQAVKTAVME